VKKTLFALPLLLAVPLMAQMSKEAPGKLDPARVTAGTYAVEPTHTLIGWTINHFGFTDYFGVFGSPTGTLKLDPAKPNGSTVSIDIPVGELFTANAKLTEHLKSADFFDVNRFATAKFVSTSVTVDGTTAKIAGTLTLKGITKPVTLDAKFTGAGYNPFSKRETVGFSATTAIKRSDWSMGTGIPLVGDDVALRISVAFEKAG
jgi:polyisoprenoid-binding protein YceI